jgi:tetratricopeptide (TPR) repeat protein
MPRNKGEVVKKNKLLKNDIRWIFSFEKDLAPYKIEFLIHKIKLITKYLRLSSKNDSLIRELGYAYFERGYAYEKIENYNKAIKDYTKAIEYKDGNGFTYYCRANAYAAKKDFTKALSDLGKSIQCDKKEGKKDSHLSFKLRANIYISLGMYKHAIKDFKSMAKDAKNWDGLPKLAEVYATCRNPKYRDGKKAVYYALKAIEQINKKKKKQKGSRKVHPYYLDLLAAAYAQDGQFKKAIECEEQAISEEKHRKTKKVYQERLKLYSQGEAYVKL